MGETDTSPVLTLLFFRFRSRSRLRDCCCDMEGTEAVLPLLLSLATFSSRMVWPLLGGERAAVEAARLGAEPAIVLTAAEDTDREMMGRVLAPLARSSRRCLVSGGSCFDDLPLRMLEDVEAALRPSTTVTLESFLAPPLAAAAEDAFPLFPPPPFVLTSKWTTLYRREHALGEK